MATKAGATSLESLPEGTVIILFLDVTDSTALTERLGDAAYRSRASKLDETLRETIRRSGGIPVEGKVLGDGIMAVFRSARQAIDGAIQCEAEGDNLGLPLHLGIHAGDVIREGATVYGGAVNLAQRVADKAAPGQILVSDTVRGLARTSVDVGFRDRGAHVLKGVAEAVRLYEVRSPEAVDDEEPESALPELGAFRAILFTDVVGVADVAIRLGDAACRQLLRTHDRIVRAAIGQVGGTEVKHLGDGIMASFPTATRALDAAVEMQRGFDALNTSDSEPLRVRIGIGAGEPVEDGGDLFGTAVMLARRVTAEAGGGEILCAEAVVQVAAGRRNVLSDRGEAVLKGFDAPQHVYEVRWRELHTD